MDPGSIYMSPPCNNLSSLSVNTCRCDFSEYAPLPSSKSAVFFSVVAEGFGVLKAKFRKEGGIIFCLPLVNIAIIWKTKNVNENTIEIFGESNDENMEWKYIIQLRFRTSNNINQGDKVVDGDIFEIGRRCRPISLQLADKNIRRVRLEIRFIEMEHNFLPKFDSGDLILRFKQGSLRVHKAILALHSTYLAQALNNVNEEAVVDMEDCDIIGFKEVLYQIYPCNRPIWANFKALAKAALHFRIEGVLEKVNSHLVNYEYMYLEQRIKEAIKLELLDAVSEMVYKAEHSGYWKEMVRSGLNAEKEFGLLVYQNIILPAIAKAKSVPYGVPIEKPFFENLNLTAPSQRERPFTIPLVVKGKKFLVNKGILAIHNDTMFARGNNGELLVQVSSELTQMCRIIGTTVHRVVKALLYHIYPCKQKIPIELVRPMLIIAYDHKMPLVMDSIQKCLMKEPPISSEHFLEHFQLAEKYKLNNLLLFSLFRIEKSCKDFVSNMISSEGFNKLQQQTRYQIMDRYCSGWSVGREYILNPTKRLKRMITMENGGQTNSNYEHDIQLATFMNINSDEAFGCVSDIACEI